MTETHLCSQCNQVSFQVVVKLRFRIETSFLLLARHFACDTPEYFPKSCRASHEHDDITRG